MLPRAGLRVVVVLPPGDAGEQQQQQHQQQHLEQHASRHPAHQGATPVLTTQWCTAQPRVLASALTAPSRAEEAASQPPDTASTSSRSCSKGAMGAQRVRGGEGQLSRIS